MTHDLNYLLSRHRRLRPSGRPPDITDIRRATLLLGTALAALIGALVACIPVRSMSDVIGVYELNAGRQKITLQVTPDQSFTESIQFSSGQVERRVGKWHWNSGSVGFDGLWIPKSFAPEYILQADSRADGRHQRYTEPGYWSVSAENHWGTVVLAVFPDADINFKMVQRFRH